MSKEFEVFIEDARFSRMGDTVTIWAVDRGDTEDRVYAYDSPSGLLEVQAQKVHEVNPNIKPLIRLPYRFAQVLFRAISEYNNKNGVKTKDESLIEGKLKATELHLTDMRELTKKLTDKLIS